jgi:hypothetical protein
VKITLSDKHRLIPRNAVGDPHFTTLDLRANYTPADAWDTPDKHPLGVLDVFTSTEVVELVNRCLYQLEYQQRSHTKRAAQQRALEQPVKEMLKRLYPGTSFAKATPEQLQHCLREIQRSDE